VSVRAAWLAGGAFVLAWGLSAACGGNARFPRRPVGCDVKQFHDAPDVPTDNIGPVQARCTEDISEADCLRTLFDAVCDLGGDVVWGVGEPRRADGRVYYSGRAAHTRAPRNGAPAP
jgi:hypothetical protein